MQEINAPQIRPCSYPPGSGATHDGESNRADLCGCCGGHASTPSRFEPRVARDLKGLFNVCDDCEAECSGYGGRIDPWWHWTNARSSRIGRARLTAAIEDAERTDFDF